MEKRDLLYIPPEVRDGYLVSGIPVEEAHVVKSVKGSKLNNTQVPVPAAQPRRLQRKQYMILRVRQTQR